jgi:hypothetical protein
MQHAGVAMVLGKRGKDGARDRMEWQSPGCLRRFFSALLAGSWIFDGRSRVGEPDFAFD